MSENGSKGKRLASLDILRGADLFLLVILESFLSKLFRATDGPVRDFLHAQFSHTEWHGFTFWDIIMPLFMFMSGITIPFSMAKYREGGVKPDGAFYLKLLRRFVILWVLGMMVQGDLLSLDPAQFKWFSNTLQAIAVGYVVAALLFVHCGPKLQIGACVTLFAAYFIVFATAGGMDTQPESNIAMTIDKAVLGMHRDGVNILDDGSWAFNPRYQYTWLLSSLNFAVTVLLGCFAGQVLRRRRSGGSNAAVLAGMGVALIAAGLALDPVFPIIKKIWSSSMTLFSGGICCLLMALSYWWVDVKGHHRGLDWLKILGMNSIAAYGISHVFSFNSLSKSVFFGLEQYVGHDWYAVIIAASNAAILMLILWWMYRKRIFLKA